MITITDEASFEAALNMTIDETLRTLLAERLELYRAEGLLDLTMLTVLEAGDTAADIERETGLNPLVNPIDHEVGPGQICSAVWSGGGRASADS